MIESIVEELPVKRDHFARLDDVVKEDAIFATNTSTLTVAELAAATRGRSASSACTSSTPCTP